MAAALTFAALLLPSVPMSAQSGPPHLTSTELLTQERRWNGKTIVFEGEVVGSPFLRGRLTWITVSDGNAIGVLLPASQGAKVRAFGTYSEHGDMVAVTGVFWRADPAEGGETDIVGRSIRILRPGYPVQHPVDPVIGWLGGALVVLAAGLWLLLRRQTQRAEAAKDTD